jgi:uncharacterized protein (TIGR03067 family)
MRRALAVLMLLALLVAADEKKPDARADADALKGIWEIVFSTTHDGKDVPAKGRTLVFSGNAFTAYTGDRPERTIAFTLDPSTNPKRIELDRGGKDGKAYGIYQLDKDELKLCYAEPGAERPKAFESKAATKVFLVVLKRAKG